MNHLEEEMDTNKEEPIIQVLKKEEKEEKKSFFCSNKQSVELNAFEDIIFVKVEK